jgi:hypothetical protein
VNGREAADEDRDAVAFSGGERALSRTTVVVDPQWKTSASAEPCTLRCQPIGELGLLLHDGGRSTSHTNAWRA